MYVHMYIHSTCVGNSPEILWTRFLFLRSRDEYSRESSSSFLFCLSYKRGKFLLVPRWIANCETRARKSPLWKSRGRPSSISRTRDEIGEQSLQATWMQDGDQSL